MTTYAVTASQRGCIIATLTQVATDALAAIEQAEQALRLQARTYHISERPGQTRQVEWTGVEFTARRIQ